MDFESALDFCIAKDYKDGPGANLIPVGKLRHLVTIKSFIKNKKT
jgi:hypothetical protein